MANEPTSEEVRALVERASLLAAGIARTLDELDALNRGIADINRRRGADPDWKGPERRAD